MTALSNKISGRETLSLADTIVATRDQVSCVLGNGAAILHLANGTYYSLNEVGGSVWNHLQNPRTIEQIRDLLIDEYDVNPNQCERDLIALLQSMNSAGLIEVTAQAAKTDALSR